MSDVQNEILDNLRTIRDQAHQIAELERQLGGKYLDAVGKHTTEEAVGLRARVAELEAERDALRAINARFRAKLNALPGDYGRFFLVKDSEGERWLRRRVLDVLAERRCAALAASEPKARHTDFDPKFPLTERERDLILRTCDTFINSPERSRLELRQAIVEDLERRFEQKAEGRKV